MYKPNYHDVKVIFKKNLPCCTFT